VAEKALTVDFKNPWQYVVDFNFSFARERADNEFSLTGVNWRRGRDSNRLGPNNGKAWLSELLGWLIVS
jgi:hypothetical protein